MQIPQQLVDNFGASRPIGYRPGNHRERPAGKRPARPGQTGKKCIRWIALVFAILAVSACDRYVPPRYSVSADNNVAQKNADIGSISVGTFSGPASFDNGCRAAGPITPPDGLNFAQYIQDAVADELKIADRFGDDAADVTLSGTVERLEFNSALGLTGSSWDIGLRVDSSNGRSTFVSEHYEFKSGFVATTACKQTAEAFVPAVQNLIGSLVSSPKFAALIGSQ